MFRYGRNEKSLSYDRLFRVEPLSLAGTHAIKATNRDPINSIKTVPYLGSLSRVFSVCSKLEPTEKSIVRFMHNAFS